MPNLATALKEEIRRLARREIKAETDVLKRASAQHRRDIARLKKNVNGLTKRIAFLEKQEKRRVGERPSAEEAESMRFSAKWLKAHRRKLGLSAADYGRLVGVSQLTIYNLESGKSKPRNATLASLASVRGLGKREALQRLEMLE